MASIKSKLFNFVLRNRHLIHGKLRKETFDMDTSISAFREQCEKGAARYAKIPDGVEVKSADVAGMKAEWLIPKDMIDGKAILYVHGGGYVSGSCNDHRGFVSKFAQQTGIANLVFEYRLAPEHPFPAALDDSVSAYRWLLAAGYLPQDILVAGESAGGGLTLALLLALKERNIELPVAALAISPWTDLSCSSDSYQTKNARSVAPSDSWKVFSRHYVASSSPINPLVSPLFGDLNGLPPLFINSAMDDELFDDGREFFEKAKAAGVEVTFRAGEGMVHCYPLMAPLFKEATEAMKEIVAFVRKYLK